MGTTANITEAKPAPSKPATAKAPDIATASVPDTLAALHVTPDTGLTHAEVDTGRKEHGYNEVARKKGHPILKFQGFEQSQVWKRLAHEEEQFST